jgi:hypothetical protein
MHACFLIQYTCDRKKGEDIVAKQTKPVQEVKKPFLTGSWYGKDVWKKSRAVLLGVLLVSFLYLILSLLLSFDSLILRIIFGASMVALAVLYYYYQGSSAGQGDTTFAEIMYQRDAEGQIVSDADRARCYHPMKGYFTALLGAAPYVLITLIFALLTVKEHYTLGTLPSWLTAYTRESGIGDALAYYAQRDGVTALVVLKVIVRCMTMPFINVAVKLGADAVLWCERLSPLWVLLAPLGYGLGYRQGPKIRNKINTGIAIGVQRKLRREKRDRKVRQQPSEPKRLI